MLKIMHFKRQSRVPTCVAKILCNIFAFSTLMLGQVAIEVPLSKAI